MAHIRSYGAETGKMIFAYLEDNKLKATPEVKSTAIAKRYIDSNFDFI
jgi:hypothetical protein